MCILIRVPIHVLTNKSKTYYEKNLFQHAYNFGSYVLCHFLDGVIFYIMRNRCRQSFETRERTKNKKHTKILKMLHFVIKSYKNLRKKCIFFIKHDKMIHK